MITDEDSESGSLPSRSSRLSREASVGHLPASGDGVCEVTPRHGNMSSQGGRGEQGTAGCGRQGSMFSEEVHLGLTAGQLWAVRHQQGQCNEGRDHQSSEEREERVHPQGLPLWPPRDGVGPASLHSSTGS